MMVLIVGAWLVPGDERIHQGMNGWTPDHEHLAGRSPRLILSVSCCNSQSLTSSVSTHTEAFFTSGPPLL